MSLAVGDLMPELDLPDQTGTLRPLRSLLGKKGLVIYFYPKDDTPGCTIEAVDFQSLRDEFNQRGYAVVGVSRDSVKSHASFCGKHNLAFTLLSDTDGRLCEAFGVWQEKKLYGKTSMGIVRSTFVLDAQGRVVRIYPAVKAAGHAASVLGDLSAG